MNWLIVEIMFCMIVFPIGTYVIQKRNLYYYQENPRTPQEIHDWLVKRRWYGVFYEHMMDYLIDNYRVGEDIAISDEDAHALHIEIENVINGKLGTDTISCAFDWKDTPEGTKFWGKRELQFLRWYYGQYIDLHLFN